MNNIKFIADSLGGSKPYGKGFKCLCPCHNDNDPSLHIDESEDGKILVHCFAGCDSTTVFNEIKNRGLLPDLPKKTKESNSKKEICRYQYINADGELLFEKIRFEPKGFLIVNPNGQGDGGNKGCLYNAQYLINLSGKTVYIVEGEKDVDTLTKLGLLACTSGGASNWPNKNNHLFKDAIVRIIPDNDDPGMEYAKKVRESLEPCVKSIKVMFIPDQYKDVSDWVCSGATKEDIESIFNQNKFKTISFSDLLKLDINTDWIIPDYIGSGDLGQFFGASGSGKSFVALEAAYCVAAGIPFLGKMTKKSNVLYIAGEGFNGLKKRAMALTKKHGNKTLAHLEFSRQSAEILNEQSCIDVADRIKNIPGGCGLVIIDTLNRNMGGGDENKTEDMTRFISNVDRHIRSLGCAVIIIHHSGLADPNRGRGSGALYNSLDSEFKISKEKSGLITIKCTKQKEGESDWEKEIMLKPVIIGIDEYNLPLYSCVIEDAGKNEVLKANDQAVLDGLKEAAEYNGKMVVKNGINVYIVEENDWRKFAFNRIDGENKRRTFRTCKEYLIEQGKVFCEDGMYFCL